MIGAKSDSMGTGARGSEPMAGDKSEVPMTQASLDVISVFDSDDIESVVSPALNPEQIVPSEDGWFDPTMEATHSAAIEPNTDFTSCETCVTGPLDSSLTTGSEPPVSVPIESDWAPIMEFTFADIFQHSPLGDVLDSLRSLSLS